MINRLGKVVSGLLFSVWSYRLARLGLAAMFLVAGALKLASPETLAVTIEALGIAGGQTAMALAISLACLEVAAGLGLAGDIRWSLGTVALLLTLFIFVLGYALHLGLDIDCGCYGPGDPEAEAFSSIRASLLRDGLMLAGAAYLLVWRRRQGFTPSTITEVVSRLFYKGEAA